MEFTVVESIATQTYAMAAKMYKLDTIHFFFIKQKTFYFYRHHKCLDGSAVHFPSHKVIVCT